MPFLKPYTGSTKLVVAFDIGTTFSGVSYCILEKAQVPEVLGVTRFPEQPPSSGDTKVPSLLYYDKSGKVRAAGAEVVSESIIETALAEEWTKAEWWKLHLRPKHLAFSINNDLPPLPSGKSAVDVLTDFVEYLFKCVKGYIQTHHPVFSWSTIDQSIEFIFTHPNGWEGEQQQMYHKAIEGAGLVPSTPEGRSRVHMLTEGEASLHFCVPNILNPDAGNLTGPQGVVIIDAGGGTIDLSMFSMVYNPISCAEIAPAECRLQGSVFVTRRAKILLQKKLNGWDRSTPDDIDEFTREFDQSTKLIIKSDQEPAYVRVAGRRTTNQEYNISFGRLKLTGEEATGLFTESFDAIIKVFEQQEKGAGMPIATAFFVGGLSANDWLWCQLQEYFKKKKITVFRPDINKVVAHGAVLSHVDRDNHLVASRVARATYGVVCSIPAKNNDPEHIRRKNQWETDPTGKYYVPGYFETKIRKGTRIKKETEFRESYTLTHTRKVDFGRQTLRLVCYRGSLPDPRWIDQDKSFFSTYCTIQVDLMVATEDLVQIKDTSGQMCYQLDYEIIVLFGLPELEAYLCWTSKEGGRRVSAIVRFEDVERPRGLNQPSEVRQVRGQLEGSNATKRKQMRQENETLQRGTAEEMEELRRRCAALTKERDSARDELRDSKGLVEERDRTITSLISEVTKLKSGNNMSTPQLDVEHETVRGTIDSLIVQVGQLKAAVAEKTEQLGTANNRVRELELEVNTFTVHLKELEGRHEMQSQEFISVKNQLFALPAFTEEKDREISKLTAERDQLSAVNALNVDQIVELKKELSDYTERHQNRQHELQSNVQYGVVCSLPVDMENEEHVRRKDLWEIDPTGECYVPGYFESKVRMGAHPHEGKEFRDAFSLVRSDPADFTTQSIRILCYRGSLSDPKWLDEDESSFSILCTIHVDLREAVTDLVMKKDVSEDVYYQLDYDVIVSFGRTDLRAELCWISSTGEQRIPARISYE